MSLFDTFYIMFKTNAAEAKKGIDEVDKASNKLEERLKKNKEAAGDLGDAFTKVVEQAAATAASVVSVWTVANKFFDTAKFNASLQVQGNILKQNTQDMLTYGSAVKSAGGTFEGFQSWLSSATQKAAEAGLPLGSVDNVMRRIRASVEGLSNNEKLRRFGLLGISDPGQIALLMQSNEQFEHSIKLAQDHAQITQKEADLARNFASEWSRVGDAFSTTATSVGGDLLPAFTALAKVLQGIGLWLAQNKTFVYGFVIGLTALMIPLAAASLAAFAPFLLLAAAVVGGAAGIGFMVKGLWDVIRGIGGSKGGGVAAPSAAPSSNAEQEAMARWMAKGYTREQASGLVARGVLESGLNPQVRPGDGGSAVGGYQWHPDRQRNILNGTGIDVRNTNLAGTIDAADWELNNTEGAARARIMAAQTPEDAGRSVSRDFIRPGLTAQAQAMEAERTAQLARAIYNRSVTNSVGAGQAAIASADSSPYSAAPATTGGNKTISLQTGPITINSQATDADGIARDFNASMQQHFQATVGNFDNGIKS